MSYFASYSIYSSQFVMIECLRDIIYSDFTKAKENVSVKIKMEQSAPNFVFTSALPPIVNPGTGLPNMSSFSIYFLILF